MATHPIVEIFESTLDALASRPDAAALFPEILGGVKAARSDHAAACGRCGKKAAAEARLRDQYARAMAAIVALPPPRLRQLKALLDADRIRLVSGRNHRGIAVRHTL